MAEADFDIDRLARYLHLTPQQVDRLATRGRLPGRKVAGKWKFSRADIHHWMEERMGLLEEGELVQVEGALRVPITCRFATFRSPKRCIRKRFAYPCGPGPKDR